MHFFNQVIPTSILGLVIIYKNDISLNNIGTFCQLQLQNYTCPKDMPSYFDLVGFDIPDFILFVVSTAIVNAAFFEMRKMHTLEETSFH